jgi:hypothetical protein
MRTYRFYGLDRARANGLADDLGREGLTPTIIPPGKRPLPDWVVEATGEGQDEQWLEVLAHFYGGRYEGEDLSGM